MPRLTEVHSVPKPRSFDDLKSWPEALAKLFHKKIPVRWAPNTLYESLTFEEECKQFPTSLALRATNTAWPLSEVHSQCDPPTTSGCTGNSKGCKPYLVLESVSNMLLLFASRTHCQTESRVLTHSSACFPCKSSEILYYSLLGIEVIAVAIMKSTSFGEQLLKEASWP